jgi:hypothetical protein
MLTEIALNVEPAMSTTSKEFTRIRTSDILTTEDKTSVLINISDEGKYWVHPNDNNHRGFTLMRSEHIKVDGIGFSVISVRSQSRDASHEWNAWVHVVASDYPIYEKIADPTEPYYNHLVFLLDRPRTGRHYFASQTRKVYPPYNLYIPEPGELISIGGGVYKFVSFVEVSREEEVGGFLVEKVD